MSGMLGVLCNAAFLFVLIYYRGMQNGCRLSYSFIYVLGGLVVRDICMG